MRATRTVCGLMSALVFVMLADTAAATSTIGLYTDPQGSSCSFSGNETGIIHAYVVIRPDADGIRGVRFAAVPPSCLGAVFIKEEMPTDRGLWIGDSQGGISLAFFTCETTPVYALDISYFRAGSTSTCCAFSLQDDPTVNMIEGTTCDLRSVTVAPAVSHFNADASCPCRDGSPPYMASDPDPQDHTPNVSVHTQLSWSPQPWDFDIKEYDVYLGTTDTPPLVATVTERNYQPTVPLQDFVRYYWRVVTRDTEGLERSSPLWTFDARGENSPPFTPQLLTPKVDAPSISVLPDMRWRCWDVDGDALAYDVYLGTSSTPPLVATVPFPQFRPGQSLEPYTLYYWRVVARDPAGHETVSPTQAFTTGEDAQFLPPTGPLPADGATDAPLWSRLSWNAQDPYFRITNFDVYFGTDPSPPLDASHVRKYGNDYNRFLPQTRYYWRIVLRDIDGHEASGPVWSFMTRANTPPFAPYRPFPESGAEDQAIDVTLRWSASDVDKQPLISDVRFGTENPPPLVASNIATALHQPENELGGVYQPQNVMAGTVYYWQVTLHDPFGGTADGPVWSFSTETGQALFSNFGAVANNANVNVTWKLNPHRSFKSYAIYRYEGAGAAIEVSNGTVDRLSGVFLDHDVKPDNRYRYEMRVHTMNGSEVRSATAAVETPALELRLDPNHPNPFNPQTTIPYSVPSGLPARVRLVIYDTAGRTVRVLVDEEQAGGVRSAVWNGTNSGGATVSSGVYYCVLQVGSERRSQKMVLLK